jgi:hypothetical protein
MVLEKHLSTPFDMWEVIADYERSMNDVTLLEEMYDLLEELWTAVRRKRAEGVDLKYPQRRPNQEVFPSIYLLMGYIVTRGKGIGVVPRDERYFEVRYGLYKGIMDKCNGVDMFQWTAQHAGSWWNDLGRELEKYFTYDVRKAWWKEYCPRVTSYLRVLPARFENHNYHRLRNRYEDRNYVNLVD